MKDSVVRRYAQRAMMALEEIDKTAAPRDAGRAKALMGAIDEARYWLCYLVGAATAEEAEEPPVDLEGDGWAHQTRRWRGPDPT